MKISLSLGDRNYEVLTPGTDISIPMHFNGPQPNTYGVGAASSHAWEGSGFVGDTRRGGSCNFESYTLVPHCNGTHTECVGHITLNRITVVEALQEEFIPAIVLTLTPEEGVNSGETYSPRFESGDRAVTRAGLIKAFREEWNDFNGALVLRTLPNPEAKKFRDWMKEIPPFFSLEAMAWIRKKGFRHLLVDFPSLDRLMDEGKLSAHRIFWEMNPGQQTPPEGLVANSTVTEFIFVPDNWSDGPCLLNLQVAPFFADAAPSRPILFRIKL